MHQKKIPTIVGLLLVGVLLYVFRFAFDRVGPLLTKASVTVEPKNVMMTNVTDTTFTVSWTTESPIEGAIRLEALRMNSVYFDDRILTSSQQLHSSHQYTTHYVTVRSLKPDATYQFRILSGGKTFQHNGQPYEVKTAPALTGLGTTIEPAYGQISLPSGEPAEGVLVYLTLTNSQTFSTLTKSEGSWVIPLNRVRTEYLNAYLASEERIDETLIIRASDMESHIQTDTINDNPLPAVTLGKSYDFRKIQAEEKSKPVAEAKPNVLGTTTTASTKPHLVAITKPTNNAVIPSNIPLFQGTGIPGKQVLITIGITQPMSDTFLVGADGIWRYTPPKPLAPGKQSVTITTHDALGKSIAITHMFEILKSGTQVLGDATPSASLTPEPTIPEDPEPTATLSGEPIPQTGSSIPLLSMLILGIAIIGSGLINVYARRYS